MMHVLARNSMSSDCLLSIHPCPRVALHGFLAFPIQTLARLLLRRLSCGTFVDGARPDIFRFEGFDQVAELRV
jgi:hypothetical protein